MNQISVNCSQSNKLEKSPKTAMFQSNPTAGNQGYQPDIKAFCTPDIMNCHFLINAIPRTGVLYFPVYQSYTFTMGQELFQSSLKFALSALTPN